MRVSFVLTTPYRADAAGGAERWVEETARALSKRATITLDYLGEGERWTAPEARRHRSLRPPGREGDRLRLAPGLVRAASRADVVHVHQFGTLSTQAAALAGRLRRRRVFVTDLGSSGLAAGRRLGLDRLFHGFLELSEFAAAQTPSARTRVIYGGVDTERFRPREKSPEPFALYVGRLLPHKGVDWLIRSLPEGMRLVVAGREDRQLHPGYLPELRSLAEGRDVTFELDPPDERVAELYATAAASVVPSVSIDLHGGRKRVPELLGLVAIEALASGTPVIASRVASLPEVVRDGVTGVLVDERDERGLGAALERLVRISGEATRMGEAGRAEVLERFTWDRVADRCLAAYREMGA